MESGKKRIDVIGDYWSDRSRGFSDRMMEHMEEDGRGLYVTLVREFSDTRRMKVLDIGCGPGLFPMLLGRDGHDVTAIDYSEGMIRRAEENCREAGVESTILRMDAQELEFPDSTFDFVVSRKVVWSLERPEDAYREWMRVLKPDGRMILYDANWFLHMNDDDYRRHHDEAMFGSGPPTGRGTDEGGFYQGADPGILIGFAKDLPLSSQRRPAWDVQILGELGAGSVKVDFERVGPPMGPGGRGLVDSFVLTVTKERAPSE